MSVPDAFLCGKIVDENDLAPRIGMFSVLTEGTLQTKHGFVRVQGDHSLKSDGTFCSPRLAAGRYFLRFFGMRRGEAVSADDMQRLAFDFIYPDAATVLEGSPIELQDGETIDLVFRVPEPKWFNVRGRIDSNLGNSDQSHVSVLFQRDMGILPDVGGIGFPVNNDGSFQGMLLKGTYSVSVHEVAGQRVRGFSPSLKRIEVGKVVVERDTLEVLLRAE